MHARDVAKVILQALEKGAAGRNWHEAVEDPVPYRQFAEAIANLLNLPRVGKVADDEI